MRSDPWDYPELYRIWSNGYREDRGFYRRLAEDLGRKGDILELACGTGRLLPELLSGDARVIGLDYSSEQLDEARRTPRIVAARDQRRLGLLRGDMARFAFRKQFALAVVAFNSLCYLIDDASRRRCLERIRDHLIPGGWLALDTDNSELPVPSSPGHFELDEVIPRYPDDDSVTRIYIAHEPVPELRAEWVRYRIVSRRGGSEQTRDIQHLIRCEPRDALVDELRGAGFGRILVFGGFDERPFVPGASELLVVLARRDGI